MIRAMGTVLDMTFTGFFAMCVFWPKAAMEVIEFIRGLWR